MRQFYLISISLLIVFTACKKKSNDTSTGWSGEDQAFYHNIISIQESACKNYEIWMKNMDSLEVIDKLWLRNQLAPNWSYSGNT